MCHCLEESKKTRVRDNSHGLIQLTSLNYWKICEKQYKWKCDLEFSSYSISFINIVFLQTSGEWRIESELDSVQEFLSSMRLSINMQKDLICETSGHKILNKHI